MLFLTCFSNNFGCWTVCVPHLTASYFVRFCLTRRLPCAFFPYSQAAAAPPPPPPPPPRISGAEGRKEEAPPPPSRCVAETTVGRFSSSSSSLPYFAGKNMGIPAYVPRRRRRILLLFPAEKNTYTSASKKWGGTFWGTFVPFVLGTYARLTSIILGNVKKRFGLDSHSANEWFFCFHNFLFIRGFQDSVYLSSKNSCTWK